MSHWDKIIEADHNLFIKINNEWHNSFLDKILPFTREPQLWIPLYGFLILFTIINFKKNGVIWVLCFGLTIVITDYISSTILKEVFMRLRPCQIPGMLSEIRLLVSECPGNPSFPSSHAVNHFAVAMFVFKTFDKPLGKWSKILFFWAITISYAQVYVGVHFPIDVTCGAIIGCLLAYPAAQLFNNWVGLLYHSKC